MMTLTAERARRRTRWEVLRMLVGSDGGLFPRRPQRRFFA